MSGGPAPRVTVLLCVHNGRPYLGEALRSVLAQTYRDLELLVVDDASTDGSREEVEALADPRVRLLANEANLGLTRSLNRGLAEARGEYVARQDADDVSWPERLARQVAFLDANPGVAVLGAQARIVDAAGRRVRGVRLTRPSTPVGVRFQLAFDNPVVHTSATFRVEVVRDRLGGYDARFRTSQDFDLWSRVAAAGHGVVSLPQVLVDFRAAPGSVSWRYSREQLERAREVYDRNYRQALRVDETPAEWLDLWLAVNNPRAFGAVPHSERCIGWLRRIHRRFVEVHPEAAGSAEVRAVLAETAARVACIAARYDRRGALANYAGALRADPRAAAPFAARFAALLAVGRWRRPLPVPGAPALPPDGAGR